VKDRIKLRLVLGEGDPREERDGVHSHTGALRTKRRLQDVQLRKFTEFFYRVTYTVFAEK
jgi:hypothetical protein